MSEYEELRDLVLASAAAQTGYNEAVGRYADENTAQHKALWQDVADLRDELHAVANRIEALTSFVVSDPAEVAAKIVTDANRATLHEVTDE